jgi:hypothetical protein
MEDLEVINVFNSAYRGRRVIISGHTGFKGSWIAYWLSLLGAEICGVSLDPDESQTLFGNLNLSERLVHDCRVDVRDYSAVAEVVQDFCPDFVFHLAAQSLVRRSYADPIGTIETNVVGVANVLEAVRQAGRPCVVVVVTTDKCYENQDRLQGTIPTVHRRLAPRSLLRPTVRRTSRRHLALSSRALVREMSLEAATGRKIGSYRTVFDQSAITNRFGLEISLRRVPGNMSSSRYPDTFG